MTALKDLMDGREKVVFVISARNTSFPFFF